jgi:hypothetical protein
MEGSVRALAMLGGTIYVVVGTAVSYRLWCQAAPRPPRLVRGAVPVPATRPTASPAPAAPAATPRFQAPPPELPAALRTPPPPPERTPPPVPLQPAVPFRVAPVRPVPRPAPAPPPPVAAFPVSEGHVNAFGDPVGTCLTCGDRAESYVEVDGRRQGYCAKHQSKLKVPVPSMPAPSMPAPATAATTASAPAEAGSCDPAAAPAQCRGVTRSGAQCRRTTRDPSGFCYQHRR